MHVQYTIPCIFSIYLQYLNLQYLISIPPPPTATHRSAGRSTPFTILRLRVVVPKYVECIKLHRLINTLMEVIDYVIMFTILTFCLSQSQFNNYLFIRSRSEEEPPMTPEWSLSPHNTSAQYLCSAQGFTILTEHSTSTQCLSTEFQLSISAQYLNTVPQHSIWAQYLNTLPEHRNSTQYLSTVSQHRNWSQYLSIETEHSTSAR